MEIRSVNPSVRGFLSAEVLAFANAARQVAGVTRIALTGSLTRGWARVSRPRRNVRPRLGAGLPTPPECPTAVGRGSPDPAGMSDRGWAWFSRPRPNVRPRGPVGRGSPDPARMSDREVPPSAYLWPQVFYTQMIRLFSLPTT